MWSKLFLFPMVVVVEEEEAGVVPEVTGHCVVVEVVVVVEVRTDVRNNGQSEISPWSADSDRIGLFFLPDGFFNYPSVIRGHCQRGVSPPLRCSTF